MPSRFHRLTTTSEGVVWTSRTSSRESHVHVPAAGLDARGAWECFSQVKGSRVASLEDTLQSLGCVSGEVVFRAARSSESYVWR